MKELISLKSKRTQKLLVGILVSSLLFNQSAFAARMGGGKSFGMQRSANSYSSNRYSTAPSTNSYRQPSQNVTGQQAPAAQGRGGLGVGSVVAGAAAGAAIGYMAGKAMNGNENTQQNNQQQVNNNQQQEMNASDIATNNPQVAPALAASQTPTDNTPWTMIFVLLGILIAGLMFFKRKMAINGSSANNGAVSQGRNDNVSKFEIPTIRKDVNNNINSNRMAEPINLDLVKLADGSAVVNFLRQAKGIFLHVQSMNNPENISEIAKYMTSELYADIRSTIEHNDFIADYPTLDCQVLDSSVENNQYITSVKFFGMVSDSPSSAAVSFAEIWHFIKPVTTDNSAKWLVAGIEQANTVH